MARRATKKRAYLAKDDRHNALLEAAASVVEKQGWPALSMISVAETAKVSRQLVYEHFASVDELMTEVMSHIFREGYENLRDTISAVHAFPPPSRTWRSSVKQRKEPDITSSSPRRTSTRLASRRWTHQLKAVTA